MSSFSISSHMPSLPSIPWRSPDLIHIAQIAVAPFVPRILLLEKSRVTLLFSSTILCITALVLFYLRKSSKSKEIQHTLNTSLLPQITTTPPLVSDLVFDQKMPLENLISLESNAELNHKDLPSLRKLIVIKLWDCPKETLKKLSTELTSAFIKKEIAQRLQTLTASALFLSKSVDPNLGEIASCLENLPSDDLPTIESYIKAKELLNFQKSTFSIPDLLHLQDQIEKNSTNPSTEICRLAIVEHLWNTLGSLSIEELQSLIPTISHAGTKLIVSYCLQARQFAASPSSIQPTHYFPIALALNPKEPSLVIALAARRLPSKRSEIEAIEQQILLLESLTNKTPFMEARLQAYRYILKPPSLPKSVPTPSKLSPEPKTPSKNPLKTLLPSYFLALHSQDPKSQEYLVEIAKNTQDINPRELAVNCFSSFQDLSLSDFENLFHSIAQIADAPLKKRIANYLTELLWEKLAQLCPEDCWKCSEDIKRHMEDKRQVVTPIKQVYNAFKLTTASKQTIDQEKDPFTIALAIALPKRRPRDVLEQALHKLLQDRTAADALVYQQHTNNLSSVRSSNLIKYRHTAYKLLGRKLEIKK